MLRSRMWFVSFALLLAGVMFAAGCDDQSRPSAKQDRGAKAEVVHHDQHSDEHSGHGGSHAPATGHVQAEITQKKCPVMGDPIDPDVFVEHEGRKVYFCCEACVEKFEKDPAKYLSKLEGG